jgi:phosphatidate cytidylyltransferase
MPLAIVTGLVLLVIVLLAFNLSTLFAAVLAVIVVTLAAGEAYAAMRAGGHKPAAALGLIASLALMVGAYNKGIAAVPLVVALCFFFTYLWFLVGVERADVIDGGGATILVFIWVGVLASFAGLLLAPASFKEPHGAHFVLGAILLTVANDVGALITGKLIGRHQLAPAISPNKTWEGAIGGAVITILVSLFVSVISGWTLSSALTLGILVSVLAPLGDLFESMFKRSLGLKDIGRMLPGHGGLLDRVDGLLFVLPATYYVVLAFHLS